jgi:hypothetical protein
MTVEEFLAIATAQGRLGQFVGALFHSPAMGHLHPPIIPGRVNAIDPYIDERWDCLNGSVCCYKYEEGKRNFPKTN